MSQQSYNEGVFHNVSNPRLTPRFIRLDISIDCRRVKVDDGKIYFHENV